MPSEEMISGASRVISRSPNRIEPDSGSTTPAMALISDVFPAPLGPIRPRISPASTRTAMSRTAATPPKLTETPSIASRVMTAPSGQQVPNIVEQALEAAGHEQQAAQQDHAVNEIRIFLRAPQKLWQAGEEHGAEHRADDRTEAADDDKRDLAQRGGDTEFCRVHESDGDGHQPTGEPGKSRRHREREQLGAPQRNPQRLRRKGALPHGVECAAEPRAL